MSHAILFPGQGSQRVGMLADLAEQRPLIRTTYEEASEVLGYDLWRTIQDGPPDDLDRTVVTQPALLAAGIAIWRVYRAEGGRLPAFFAGHSLGEYTALVAAHALDFADAVRLVEQRGRFMEEAAADRPGAMLAIVGLDDTRVETLCTEASGTEERAVAANYNAPGQVVVAGHQAAIRRLDEAARAAGAKRVVELAVSVPSHTPLMHEATRRLRMELEALTWHEPARPVVHNATARPANDPRGIRDALAQQLDHPVRWTDSVRWLVHQGIDTCFECGPGKVLCGLVRRINRNLTAIPLSDPSQLEEALNHE